MLSIPCTVELCSLACTLLAAGSRVFDFEVASHMLEAGDRTGELALAFRERRQRDVVDATLRRLRGRVEESYQSWLQAEFRGNPAGLTNAQAAIAALDAVLPRCLPDKAAIVAAKYDPAAIAALAVERAAAADDQFARGSVGARVLASLVRQTYTTLWEDAAFAATTEIPFRAHVLTTLDDHGDKLAAILAAVTVDKGVPLAVLQQILECFGENVPRDPHVIEQRLRAKADEYVSLRAELKRATTAVPNHAAVRAEALRLIDDGNFDGARAELADARGRLRQLREQAGVQEARLLTEEAGIARLQYRYADAARLYSAAAGLVTLEPSFRWRCLVLAALAIGEDGLGDEREPLLVQLARQDVLDEDAWSLATDASAAVPSADTMTHVANLITRIDQAPFEVFPAWSELHSLADLMQRLESELPSVSCLLAECALRRRIAHQTETLTTSDPIDIELEHLAAREALERLARLRH